MKDPYIDMYTISFCITLDNLFNKKTNELCQIIDKVIEKYLLKLGEPTSIFVELDGRNKLKKYKFNNKNLDKLKEMIINQDVSNIFIGLLANEDHVISNVSNADYGFSITLSTNNKIRQFGINQRDRKWFESIAFSINTRIINNKKASFVFIKDFFFDILVNYKGNSGFIDCGFSPAQLLNISSPYEGFARKTYYQFYNNIDNNLRGVYFGNLINYKILDNFGGIKKIKQELSFPMQEIEIAGKKCLYIQLSEDIENISVNEIMKFHSYFISALYPNEVDLSYIESIDPDKVYRTKYNMFYWL